jgi:hypothetical protein
LAKLGARYLLLLASVLIVEGCSSLQLEEPRASIISSAENNGPASGADITGTTTAKPSQQSQSRARASVSEVVRANARLFSADEDHKPMPKPGTLEWKEEKERKARMERELRETMRICRC